MKIEAAAKREVDRISKIMPGVKQTKSSGGELISFAQNYASDATFFLKRGKNVEAFEAAVIAWAYVDVGIKLGLLTVPAKFMEDFTTDKL